MSEAWGVVDDAVLVVVVIVIVVGIRVVDDRGGGAGQGQGKDEEKVGKFLKSSEAAPGEPALNDENVPIQSQVREVWGANVHDVVLGAIFEFKLEDCVGQGRALGSGIAMVAIGAGGAENVVGFGNGYDTENVV